MHLKNHKFHKRFQKQKLIGLINTDVAPGITNLLAKEVADKFDRLYRLGLFDNKPVVSNGKKMSPWNFFLK